MAKVIDFTFLLCLKEYKQILNSHANKANQSKLWRKRYPKEIRDQVLKFLHCEQRIAPHSPKRVKTKSE